jgi:hypothetical protein
MTETDERTTRAIAQSGWAREAADARPYSLAAEDLLPDLLPADYAPPEVTGRPRQWIEVPVEVWAQVEDVLAAAGRPLLAAAARTAAETRAYHLRKRKRLHRGGHHDTAIIDGRIVALVAEEPSIEVTPTSVQ